MADQYEEFAIDINDRSAQAGAKRVNAALEGMEKKATGVNEAVGRSAEGVSSKLVSITSKSANSIERIVVSAEKRAAALGSTSATQRLQAELSSTVARLRGDEVAIGRVTAAYQKLIEVQTTSVGSRLQGFLGNTAGRFLSIAGAATVLASAFRGIGDGILYSIQQAQGLRQTENLFAAIFKSRSEAVGLRSDLINLARTYPAAFDIGRISKAAELLVAFKFSAKDAVTVLDSLGRAGSLGPEKVERLVLAIGQIGAKGKLQGEEVLQLAEAGVGAAQALQKALRQNPVDFAKTLEKGIIPSKEAIAVILQDIRQTFGDSAQQAAQTSTGLFNTLKLNLQLAAVGFGDAIDPVVVRVLQSLLPVSRAFENIESILERMGASGAGPRFFDVLGKGIAQNFPLIQLLLGAFEKLDQFANKPRQEAILKQLNTGKSAQDLAAIGITQEEIYSRFGKAQGEQLIKQFSIVSAQKLETDEAAKNLLIQTEKNAKLTAGAVALRAQADAAKRVQESLTRLRDERDASRIALEAGSSDEGRRQRELLSIQRQLTKEQAGRSQIEDATSLVQERQFLDSQLKSTELLAEAQKRLADGREKAGKRAVELEFGQLVAAQNTRNEIEKITQDAIQRRGDIQLESQIQALQQSKDLDLAALTSSAATSVASKVNLEQQKLAIEVQYLQRSEALELQKLDRTRAATVKALEAGLLGASAADAAKIRADIAAIDSTFDAQKVARNQTTVNAETILRSKAAGDISRIQIEEQDRVFDRWQQSYSRTLDTLFSTTRSWGDRMRALLEAAILTPLKEAFATGLAALTVGSRGTQTGRQSGSFAGLFGGLLGGGRGLAGFGGAAAPGGTPTFSGAPVPGAGGLGQVGALSGFAGLRGGLSALGNLGRGPTFNPTSGPGGFGGAAGGLALIGGGILAADGLRRGGLVGTLQATAGGALIGAKFGGPLGAAIGAGIGLGAGLIRSLFSSADEKVRKEVQAVHGVDVREKSIRQQIMDIARSSFGGNLQLAVRSQQVYDLVGLYKMTQDLPGGSGRFSPIATELVNRNGSLFQSSVFQNGASLVNSSVLPVLSSNGGGAPSFTLQLDPGTTTAILQGQALEVINGQPRAVAEAAANGQRSGAGLNTSRGLVEPLTAFA
jgi:tape measure domain-containing protein